MVLVAVLYYQQSLDEGREWIIARTFPLPHILFRVLHYEGHPPLVYILLWLPAHLHMPYPWINWLSAAVGLSSIYLLLRLSPFPFYVRALLPFCFALGYQEVVVARSYVLFPLLGFLAAHLYRTRPPRPLAMAATLALLANVSFHGTLVAIGLGIAYALRFRRERKNPLPSEPVLGPLRSRSLWPATMLFLASLVLVAVCIYPEKYNQMTPRQAVSRIFHRAQGPQQEATGGPGPRVPTVNPAPSMPSVPAKPPAGNFLRRHKDVLWLAFVYPVSSFAPLSLAFEIVVACFLCWRRQWALILPIAILDYFLIFGFVAYRHTPLVWITLLIVLWAAWDAAPRPGLFQIQRMVSWALAILSVLQIPWTLAAIHYEFHHATYPAKATAAYLRTLPSNTSIDGDKVAYAILPYRPGYVPVDRAHGRFADHASYATSATIDSFLSNSPDVLLLNETLAAPSARARLQAAGYMEVHTSCGGPYFPNIPVEVTCFHVFSRR
jgi:hypothetical protein